MPPNPPNKAHGFAMRSMSLCDMQIPKSGKKKFLAPPCQILGTPLSIHDVQALCSSYDMVFIQESWLFQYELPILSRIDSESEGFGLSAIDGTTNIVQGRPYGGMAILIKKKYRSMAQFHDY